MEANREGFTMEIKGKIVELLQEKSGQSVNGEWRKQEYILETRGQYPKKICFTAWGDKIDQFSIQQGDMVEVSVDLESREYNGRWYTDVKAWRVSKDVTDAYNPHALDLNDRYTTESESISDLGKDEIPF